MVDKDTNNLYEVTIYFDNGRRKIIKDCTELKLNNLIRWYDSGTKNIFTMIIDDKTKIFLDKDKITFISSIITRGV